MRHKRYETLNWENERRHGILLQKSWKLGIRLYLLLGGLYQLQYIAYQRRKGLGHNTVDTLYSTKTNKVHYNKILLNTVLLHTSQAKRAGKYYPCHCYATNRGNVTLVSVEI